MAGKYKKINPFHHYHIFHAVFHKATLSSDWQLGESLSVLTVKKFLLFCSQNNQDSSWAVYCHGNTKESQRQTWSYLWLNLTQYGFLSFCGFWLCAKSVSWTIVLTGWWRPLGKSIVGWHFQCFPIKSEDGKGYQWFLKEPVLSPVLFNIYRGHKMGGGRRYMDCGVGVFSTLTTSISTFYHVGPGFC